MTTRADRYNDSIGLCPHCHRIDGMAHAGRSNWFFCRTHRIMWTIGYVFSSKLQTEEEQRQIWHAEGLEEFEVVRPYIRPPDDELPQFEQDDKLCPI